MKYISDFLVNNWQLVVAVILSIISFILALVRKKPVKVIDDVKSLIYQSIPIYINYAEEKFGAGNGDKKKNFVIDRLFHDLKTFYPNFDASIYLPFISSFIEAVLNTPQKKGEK